MLRWRRGLRSDRCDSDARCLPSIRFDECGTEGSAGGWIAFPGIETARPAAAGSIRYGTTAGRWALAATVLASGVALLDSTVVNVALPAIAEDLDAGVRGLQWTVDAYLLTLTSLLLLGGSLGDRLGRRRLLVSGMVAFVAASLLCGLAPGIEALIAARALQGVGAAFLVPGSLALISASFVPDDRSRAVGAWSGLVGTASAVGPFVGGWLIDAASWRFIFLINVPLAAVAVWLACRHLPESRDQRAGPPDVAGAVTITVALAGIVFALIEGPSHLGPLEVASGVVGVAALAAFVVVERSRPYPMLPCGLFSSPQFTGANLTTLFVYAGLGGALFLVVLRLQVSLGYSALEAGTSLLPLTVLMLLLSPRAARLSQRTGPRLPMTVGPLVASLGLALFARVEPGASYLGVVFPAAAVFGAGMTLTVAPLTAAVLAAVEERHVGVGSAVNNAFARLAGLLAVAALPGLAGIELGARAAETLGDGFPPAMRVSAALCAAGGLIAWVTVRTGVQVEAVPPAGTLQPCHEPSLVSRGGAAGGSSRR